MKRRLFTLFGVIALSVSAAVAGTGDDQKDTKKKDPLVTAGKATGTAGKEAGKAAATAGKAIGKTGAQAGKTAAEAGKKTAAGAEAVAKGTAHGVTTAGRATGKAMQATGAAVARVFEGNSKYKQPEMVRAAQNALLEKGHYQGAIDGIAGPKTRFGLREFQRGENLKVTGKLNAATAGRLGID